MFIHAFCLLGLALAMMMSTTPVSASSDLELNVKTKTIAVGDKTTLTVKNATKKATYKWTSSNKKVVSITKKGVITGKKVGATTITCTVKQGKKSTQLTAKINVLQVKKAGTKVVTAGETKTLKVNSYKNATYKWTSSNKKIASVNAEGVVIANAKGTATIRCQVNTPKKQYIAQYKIQVNTEKKVATQSQLNTALKNKKITSLTIETTKEVDLTIPEGDYSNVALMVNTPNGDITNHGVFQSIKIKMIKPNTWHEKANGNKITVQAPEASIIVEQDSVVDMMSFTKKGANVKVQVDGTVKGMKVTKENQLDLTANGKVDRLQVNAPSNILIAGTTKDAIPVTMNEKAEGATLESSVKVTVETPVKVDISLQQGAEGSAVTVTDEKADVKVENKTEDKVQVSTPNGDKEVGTGETITTDNSDTSNDGDTNDGTTNGGTSGGSTGNGSTGDGNTGSGSVDNGNIGGNNTGSGNNGEDDNTTTTPSEEGYTIKIYSPVSIKAGLSTDVSAWLYEDGKAVSGQTITWKSSNPELLKLEQDTSVTGENGKTKVNVQVAENIEKETPVKITATYNNGSKTIVQEKEILLRPASVWTEKITIEAINAPEVVSKAAIAIGGEKILSEEAVNTIANNSVEYNEATKEYVVKGTGVKWGENKFILLIQLKYGDIADKFMYSADDINVKVFHTETENYICIIGNGKGTIKIVENTYPDYYDNLNLVDVISIDCSNVEFKDYTDLISNK